MPAAKAACSSTTASANTVDRNRGAGIPEYCLGVVEIIARAVPIGEVCDDRRLHHKVRNAAPIDGAGDRVCDRCPPDARHRG